MDTFQITQNKYIRIIIFESIKFDTYCETESSKFTNSKHFNSKIYYKLSNKFWNY